MKNSLFTIVMLILPFIASTQTRVWDGGGSTNNWSEANNWDCNCLPAAGEIAQIPSVYSTITVNVDVAVSVAELHSYANLNVNASITTTSQFRVINGADLTVAPSVTINAGSLVLISVSHSSGQVWNCNVNNQGTITTSTIYMQEGCDPGFPCHTALTNNGTITTSSLGIQFEDHTQVINNNSMTLNGATGIQMIIASAAASFINHGVFNSNTYNYLKNTTNTATGVMTIDNYPNSIDPITFAYTSPMEIIGTVTNQGIINMTNPQSGAFYGIQVKPTTVFTSSGNLNITSQRFPIRNEGTTNISGTSYIHATDNVYQAGIENMSTFNLNNAATTFTCTKNFRNLTGGVLTIENCKPVNLLTLHNQGTTTNNGTITFDPLNVSSTSLTQIGTFTNNGIMINCAFPVTLPAAENPGLFAQRIMGTKCTNVVIPAFISGQKININNAPTSGIFTNVGLTTSTGTLNWVLDEFTPNIACVGLNILYIQVQKNRMLASGSSCTLSESNRLWYLVC
jgi:hypothetical protein